MPDQPHPIGSTVRIEGDKRYPKPRLARILGNDTYPLYYVRLADEGDTAAPSQYDTRKPTSAVTHSKLVLVA
jgi:hypothetical protein